MPTVEQKIEQLLHDLDKYARNYDYDDACGLPCYDAFAADEMKAIVQAFVDNLKDGDNTKDFDENQLNAYRAFIKVGIPDEWAKAMADRVVDNGWEGADHNAPSMLEHFAIWGETLEGAMFWCDLVCAVRLDDVDAFSKFQCPK